jgi:type IV pilus assembly protein PilM
LELFSKNRVKNKRVDGRDSWKMIREPRQKDMGLYGGILHKLAPKKTRFAAIDIGASEIKLVEISTAEGHRVVTAYGKVATPLDNLDDLADEEVMVNALKDLVLTSGLETREVITTISADKVITRHIRLPLMPDKELEAALRFEVEKLVVVAGYRCIG